MRNAPTTRVVEFEVNGELDKYQNQLRMEMIVRDEQNGMSEGG